MLLTRKSSRSIIVPPNIEKPSHCKRLNPSTQGSERVEIRKKFIAEDFFLLKPVSSIVQQIIFSNTANIVERAAKDINRKKMLPHNLPIGIFANILGSVMKIRLGPEVWSTLYVKQAGNIIRPAEMATNVSRTTTLADSPRSVLFIDVASENRHSAYTEAECKERLIHCAYKRFDNTYFFHSFKIGKQEI